MTHKLSVKILGLFIVYFITAKFGLSLSAVSNFATLIWLPSGISLAALLIFGSKLWPAITLGAFLANYFTGAPIQAALGIAIGNTLEALIGTFFLKSMDFNTTLDSLRDVLYLTLTAIFASLLSATIGVTSLSLVNQIPSSLKLQTWSSWWIGDLISILVVTSFILTWFNKTKFKFSYPRLLEIVSIWALSTVIYLIVFEHFLQPIIGIRPTAYMIFPPLIWTALRFGPPGATLAILITSIFTTLGTLNYHGPFASGSTNGNLLSVQIFMSVTSVTTMIMAAVLAERKKTEKLKDEFISMAAHELKTPITTIKGYTQLLTKNFQKQKRNRAYLYTSKMTTQIDNLARLISDFFDVSKIETGKMDLQKEEIDFDHLVKDVAIDMQHLVNSHKIILKGESGKIVSADKFRINQVLINLILNAAKFSPKSKKIEVIISGNGHHARASVRDFGIGINKSDTRQIFNRFFQANTKIRKSEAGLGLGLYIASEIIHRHHGKIWVNSHPGKGSTFTFSLPALPN